MFFQPHHLLIQSEDGKSVYIDSTKLDNGKIDKATALRLSSLTYTNVMTSFTDSDKTFTIEIYPYTFDNRFLDINHNSNETPVTISIEMDITKRYTLTTLVADMISKIDALAAIPYTVTNGSNPGTYTLLPKDYIAFDIFPDQGLLETTVKQSWQANFKKNLKLGFKEDTLKINPMYQAQLDTVPVPTGSAALTNAQIQATEYKVYGTYLVQLAPTDVLHVECNMCDGQDFISNLERSSQKILHTIGVSSYWGNVTSYVNQTGSPIGIVPKEHTSVQVKILDRNRNEVDFRGVGWVASLELSYD